MSEDSLSQITSRLHAWLMKAALPLWWERGADHVHGGFHDALDLNAMPVSDLRRGRVQGRQCWVYALAGSMGWTGPWRAATQHGLDFLLTQQRRPDGQVATLLNAAGQILDRTAFLYDQSFALLALSEAAKLFPDRSDLRDAAHRMLDAMRAAQRHPGGGYREAGSDPYQSNAHMHLLEAALAWRAIEPDGVWDDFADEIAQLSLTRLIDPRHGFISEFYGADWKPAGHTVEPGHQFEWAWLLERWGRLRGHDGARAAARKLYDIGAAGIDPRRGVAMDELSDDLSIVRSTARLWPQTERIKAAMALAAASSGVARDRYRTDAVAGGSALWRYLEMKIPGLWRDRMTADGGFVEEPAPASSLYHLICAVWVLTEGKAHGGK